MRADRPSADEPCQRDEQRFGTREPRAAFTNDRCDADRTEGNRAQPERKRAADEFAQIVRPRARSHGIGGFHSDEQHARRDDDQYHKLHARKGHERTELRTHGKARERRTMHVRDEESTQPAREQPQRQYDDDGARVVRDPIVGIVRQEHIAKAVDREVREDGGDCAADCDEQR